MVPLHKALGLLYGELGRWCWGWDALAAALGEHFGRVEGDKLTLFSI